MKNRTVSFRCDEDIIRKLDKIVAKVDEHQGGYGYVGYSDVIIYAINLVSKLNLDDMDIFMGYWGECNPLTFKEIV